MKSTCKLSLYTFKISFYRRDYLKKTKSVKWILQKENIIKVPDIKIAITQALNEINYKRDYGLEKVSDDYIVVYFNAGIDYMLVVKKKLS